MRYWLVVLGVASLTFLGLCLRPGSRPSLPTAEAWAGAAPTLSEYMLVVHGQKGINQQLGEVLQGGSVDDKAWKTVQARLGVVTFLAETVLPKAKPDKGEADSWKTKSGEYLGLLRAAGKAAAKKDAAGTKAELGRLSKSCEGCHKAHR